MKCFLKAHACLHIHLLAAISSLAIRPATGTTFSPDQTQQDPSRSQSRPCESNFLQYDHDINQMQKDNIVVVVIFQHQTGV